MFDLRCKNKHNRPPPPPPVAMTNLAERASGRVRELRSLLTSSKPPPPPSPPSPRLPTAAVGSQLASGSGAATARERHAPSRRLHLFLHCARTHAAQRRGQNKNAAEARRFARSPLRAQSYSFRRKQKLAFTTKITTISLIARARRSFAFAACCLLASGDAPVAQREFGAAKQRLLWRLW